MHPIQFPNGLETDTFLQKYWQQKPLYMPQAWPDFSNPISPEELAGLALESEMPSRIIEQHSAEKWSVRQGPFTEADFAGLDGKTWSLLITDIEKYLPEFMDYVQPFRFIPDWRFDDMMISYAPAGGSVGPHMDDYDTFLIQALGERHWQLEGEFRNLPFKPEDLIIDTDLRLIKHFNTTEEYHCQAGDILYLPPRIGHYGIAQNDCMTWSMGFKAPNLDDMLADYLDDFADTNEHKRFTDPNLNSQTHAGEISAEHIQNLQRWFTAQINTDDDTFARWAGRFLSRRQHTEDLLFEPNLIHELKQDQLTVETNPFVKFEFIQLKGKTYLYAGSEEFVLSLSLAKQLSSKAQITLTMTTEQDQSVIKTLLNKGYLTTL